MNIHDLRQKIPQLLHSGRSNLYWYGMAYIEIFKEWDKTANPAFSEEIELQKVAKWYYKKQEDEYNKYGKQEDYLKMIGATHFFLWNVMSKSQVAKLLKQFNIKTMQQAKQVFQKQPYYNTIDPDIVVALLSSKT
jgi:hypothetical protein